MKISLFLLFSLLINRTFSSEPKILFYQNDSVFVVNEEFETIKVLPYKSNAILSPDYNLIFYTQGNRDWSVKFCIYNLETDEVFKSQKFEDKNYFLNPQWSNNSDKIIYKTITRDEDGNVFNLLEGYNFSTNKLFQINLDHLPDPHVLNFCSYDFQNLIMCDDTYVYVINERGTIIQLLDFGEIYAQLPGYTKPEYSVGDTLFYLNDLSLIYPPYINNVFRIDNSKSFVLTAIITNDLFKKHNIGERAIFYFDDNNKLLEQLTPDSIAIENIQVIDNRKILFNGFSISDSSSDGGWGDYYYHKSESGELVKNDHYFKKHIFEIDLITKKLKIAKRNAILSRSQKL